MLVSVHVVVMMMLVLVAVHFVLIPLGSRAAAGAAARRALDGPNPLACRWRRRLSLLVGGSLDPSGSLPGLPLGEIPLGPATFLLLFGRTLDVLLDLWRPPQLFSRRRLQWSRVVNALGDYDDRGGRGRCGG